jgi:hypothetical protein
MADNSAPNADHDAWEPAAPAPSQAATFAAPGGAATNSVLKKPPASESRAGYCLAQTITALAPPSQLAPVVPSMRVTAPPAQ